MPTLARFALLTVLLHGFALGAPIDGAGFAAELEPVSLLKPVKDALVSQTQQSEASPQSEEAEGVSPVETPSLVVAPADTEEGQGPIDVGGEIPEPSTVSLVVIAGAMLAWKRRRK